MEDIATDWTGVPSGFAMLREPVLRCLAHCCSLRILIMFLILITAQNVDGNPIHVDREFLLQLKLFLQKKNKISQGRYTRWKDETLPLCFWPGITCNNGRVTEIDLSSSDISGPVFGNFSAFTELRKLDLSNNTLTGEIPRDLNFCKNIRHLNLSHNTLEGELDLHGLEHLETLDVTLNRLQGGIQSNLRLMCSRLVTLNLSTNSFSGEIVNVFDNCYNLQNLDISSNMFSGPVWKGFGRLRQFFASENVLTGQILPEFFTNCSLQILDLSVNNLTGEIPKQISNCKDLVSLNLFGNDFHGDMPKEIGSFTNLESLYLGSNRFSREIPAELLNCSKLLFLDLSNHNFGGDIQNTIGKFKQLKYLVLHGNGYTGGLLSSGILQLPYLERLDLSFNRFSSALPGEISRMRRLQFLMLAYNQFSGEIPSEYGNLSSLQALDLSFNNLTGRIPPSIGNLTSLLWLMLAGNSLRGEIPREIGKCRSLLWLNLADNQLSGRIPSEISNTGQDPEPTFISNRKRDKTMVASGECIIMKRWIPASYPPFSFVYTILTRKICRSIWDGLLRGHGIFPLCQKSSSVRLLVISGYLQLARNNFSGHIPMEIAGMQRLSLLDLAMNKFSGALTPALSKLPLSFLNVSFNRFSGSIPEELGDIKCLQNLDLSCNNFSGNFPAQLNRLTELNKFNVSYNPLLMGTIPAVRQFATFGNDSFFGNPLLVLGREASAGDLDLLMFAGYRNKSSRPAAYAVFLALTLAFIICGAVSFGFYLLTNDRAESTVLLADSKRRHDLEISSGDTSASPHSAGVFHLGNTAFTYEDIAAATDDFSIDAFVGAGGFGTVYKGVLGDGRVVAVKKLRRQGPEGEREFRSEMEILSGRAACWPHRNLVPLLGWCLHGSEQLLVYEFMDGGSLEDVISDQTGLGWKRRVEIATDVARALVYLHHDCHLAVVHRDVKASNVLLDRLGNARVTDFGLARIVRPGDSHVSTIVAGTVGYVAPEYAHTWRATTKGDVYSFGVLALELSTGRRTADGTEEGLVDWARRVSADPTDSGLLPGVEIVAQTPALEPLEARSPGNVNERWMIGELLTVGLICTADAPQARPNMKEVLAMLVRILHHSSNSDFEVNNLTDPYIPN